MCSNCRVSWWHEPPEPSQGHVAFYAYANPVVRKLICAWKYDYDLSGFALLKEHAQDLLPALRAGVAGAGVEAIIPLPLSGHRLRERGFNQSDMIAEWLSGELGLPVLRALERSHRRGHQADRSIEEREQAMADSPFQLKLPTSLPDTVLLVDDVWTTGATLTAAKKVLERNGQTKVSAFTLAKG